MAVLASMERTATIETMEPRQFLRFDGDDFLAPRHTYPGSSARSSRRWSTLDADRQAQRDPEALDDHRHGLGQKELERAAQSGQARPSYKARLRLGTVVIGYSHAASARESSVGAGQTVSELRERSWACFG